MTLAEAKREVRLVGYTLKYNADTREYSVKRYGSSDGYYTDDRQDAVDTARKMDQEWRERFARLG